MRRDHHEIRVPGECRILGWPAPLALFLVVLAATAWAADPLEEVYAAQGRLFVARLANAPFPHPARAEGHTYHEILYTAPEHYSDNTVALFIPKGFRATARVDFVVHFHGWRNTVAGTLATYHLAEQLVASGKNAVLVVPEGPSNAPDSFGGKLEDEGGFARFMGEIVGVLAARAGFPVQQPLTIGRIILSGHSGGGEVIASVLARGGLAKNADEVWLFDALYSPPAAYLAWADRTHGRLLDLYTDHGGTKANSENLMALLVRRGTPPLAVEETQLDARALSLSPLTFIHTDLAHDDVMAKRGEFALFLKTSGLEDR
ncbi:MAG: hypothetical protein ACHQ5A_06095 [Opitutales bacterium]